MTQNSTPHGENKKKKKKIQKIEKWHIGPPAGRIKKNDSAIAPHENQNSLRTVDFRESSMDLVVGA